ncbi:MAG: hypothetical protein V3S27_10880 [Kiloniellales bacterium]
MSERTRQPPRLSEQGRAQRESRRARLAEALRANLKKRKAQARGRAEAADTATGGRDPESGGEAGGEA